MFVQFTKASKDESGSDTSSGFIVLVNPSLVAHLEQTGDKATTIHLSTGSAAFVAEPIHDVARRLAFQPESYPDVS